MKWIVRLYIFFVGIILTMTTGFGIAAFYPEPIRPAYPVSSVAQIAPQSCYATPQEQSSKECQELLKQQNKIQEKEQAKHVAYEKQTQAFANISAGYTRTAIFLGITIGALFAIIGLVIFKLSKPVSNGILLAGVLTAVLTRIIISLASFGANVSGTTAADSFSYLQFGILALLSVAVIGAGFTTLKGLEEPSKH